MNYFDVGLRMSGKIKQKKEDYNIFGCLRNNHGIYKYITHLNLNWKGIAK